MGHIWQAFGQVMGWKGKDSAILWHYNTIRLKISIVWYLCLLEAMQTNDFSKKNYFGFYELFLRKFSVKTLPDTGWLPTEITYTV